MSRSINKSEDTEDINDTIHGISWIANQGDDRLTFVGNQTLNESKPIQSSMRPCEARHDWSDFAYLQDDVTLRVDGSPANVGNLDYMQWVEITREFWWTTTIDEQTNEYQVLFSLKKEQGWRHFEKGQLIARYKGYTESNKGYSVSGKAITRSRSLINFAADIKATCSSRDDMYVQDFDSYNTITWLMYHDIGRFNVQDFFAKGVQSDTISGDSYGVTAYKTGYTDTLTTPSGKCAKATNDTSSGVNINEPFRWRFIENYYAHIWEFRSGVYCVNDAGARWTYICQDITKLGVPTATLAQIKEIIKDWVKACVIPTANGWVAEYHLPYIVSKLPQDGTATTKKCHYSYNNANEGMVLLTGGRAG
ncbi:MAG: hypothetical protein ACRC6R_08415, partial [Bacteroidales bacterium]